MHQFMSTLTWLGFFAATFLSFFYYLNFRNKERMALIEKGVDVSEVYKRRDLSFKFPWLRLGILIFGIGVGIFFAFLFLSVAPWGHFNDDEGFIVTFSLFTFGGLAIVIGDILERSRNKKNG